MLQGRRGPFQALAAEVLDIVGRRLPGRELADQGMEANLVGLEPFDQAGVLQSLHGAVEGR